MTIGDAAESGVPLCPSAQPEMDGSVAFGVVGGTVEEPRVIPLRQPQAATEELLALAAPLAPTEVFRFAAPCAGTLCQHFDGANCRLAQRIVTMLPDAAARLPRCSIRPRCRWWQQEGPTACLRCPGIVTTYYHPPDQLREAAESPAGQLPELP